ncbi:MAG: type II secretion system F family protein [Candidatus Omnitrophica bacterium]|nr:type II secretion system F family protein [Candidatus Omnitrophota bacterium]MDD5436236.1 type II secretion system F family protein [Candidatus Omnitrophota bacterium]
MARFLYEAKKGPKDVVKGVLVADNRASALQKIAQMGYYLMALEEENELVKSAGEGKGNIFARVSLKDIADFTRQLSDLLESGLTIVKALDLLHDQTPNKKFKRVIMDIRDFCVSGSPLSEALSRHPKVFSNLYASMVRSGETGGALEKILKRLSDFSEKQLEIQTKIRTALAYPILMSVVGLATVTVLMTFVIPKMMVMFADLGQALPLPTQILLAISNAFKNYWWVIIALIFVAGVFLTKAYATPEGRIKIDRLKLKAPVFGALGMKVEIARFARTLATLLENGVPILESLKVTSETIGNGVIKGEVDKAYDAVREGSSLARGFSGSVVIPPTVMNMIAIGEEAGHLEKSLFKIAQTYDRESDEAIKIMMSLLEPILILTMGVVVGFIVIAMLLPIFEINFMMR